MSEELTPYVSWQDYFETLKTLPKAKMLDLFQSRHIRSMIVRVFFISIEMCIWISLLLKTYMLIYWKLIKFQLYIEEVRLQ